MDLGDLFRREPLVVKCRSLNSELSPCFSGSTPVQFCPDAVVCLSSVLPTRGTRHAVPTVSRGSTYNSLMVGLKNTLLMSLLITCSKCLTTMDGTL